jgi:hypothetical protein
VAPSFKQAVAPACSDGNFTENNVHTVSTVVCGTPGSIPYPA